MDVALDEDFVNFESVSQTCSSAQLSSAADEELILLDSEVSRRERNSQDEKEREKNNNELKAKATVDPETLRGNVTVEIRPFYSGGEMLDRPFATAENHLFTTFSLGPTNKRLTMIPFKYKLKEERRKVLKISVNKLKKIDDPESWLCRSVLINNTMKKLQRETRDEKINKHINVASCTTAGVDCVTTTDGKCFTKSENENNHTSGDLENNNNNNNNEFIAKECEFDQDQSSECGNLENRICNRNDVTLCERERESPHLGKPESESAGEENLKFVPMTMVTPILDVKNEVMNVPEANLTNESDSICCSLQGPPTDEDSADRIPCIPWRCWSRKKSLDEDGRSRDATADEEEPDEESTILNGGSLEEVDDVHDVLSQLYLPPTPRMLTSIDGSDTEDDEFNVVVVDVNCCRNERRVGDGECQTKLPDQVCSWKESTKDAGDTGEPTNVKRTPCRDSPNLSEVDLHPRKRPKLTGDVDYLCEESRERTSREQPEYCGNSEVTKRAVNGLRDTISHSIDLEKQKEEQEQQQQQQQQEHEEDNVKRRLLQNCRPATSGHHNWKPEKSSGDVFFDEGCENQYSCGHAVTMFADLQAVTFHNLIASLET